MSRRVVFVSSELEPYTTGGAGSVVARLSTLLAEHGVDTAVVLAADRRGGADGVTYAVAHIDEEAPTPFLARSRAAAIALSEAGAPDLVEFQDFEGLGFWALAHREQLGLSRTRIMIRVHGPFDMLIEHLDHVSPELGLVAVMERQALKMADVVLAPSRVFADLITERFGLDADRVVVGQPPLVDVPRLDYQRSTGPEIVCLGRLAEVKGSVDFLEAALPMLANHSGLRIRFVGEDGWSSTADRPMGQWMESMVPNELADRVRFSGRIARDAWATELTGAWLAVIPSRFESFGLAAHEARAAGLPVLLSDLVAYRPYFSRATGAVTYDGSIDGLRSAMEDLISDPAVLDDLAAAPLPEYDDPLTVYSARLPPPRHPQSQAGLGTTAVNALDSASKQLQRPKRGAGIAKALLRVLPSPLARLARAVLPQAAKDRFRGLASWPEEVERRHDEERRRSIQRRAKAGEFSPVEDPQVTVIIPCFNQGEYLWDALVSVHEQDFDPWEIVVVDDGSDDPLTVDVIRSLDLPRVRTIHQPNAGLAAARNAAIHRARGEFVVPLDADDQLAPEFLSDLHSELNNHPDAAYAHCWAELFGDVHYVWATRPYNPYQLLLANSVVGCVMLRRDAWDSVGGYDESMREGNEDWELWVRLMAAGWGQRQVKKPLFRYRKRGSSMSVETESQFEAGRAQVAERNRLLYNSEALRDLKAANYPMVSLIAKDPEGIARQDTEDLEVIEASDPHEGLRMARGKYVMHWPVGDVPASFLRELAMALESEPKRMAAGPGGDAVLWRRWSILDPDSPHAGVVSAGTGSIEVASPFARGRYPEPDWQVPATIDGLATQRQSPEVEAFLPDWV